jgi:hypothetical protein
MYDFWRLYREGGGKKGVFLVFFRHFRGGGFLGFLGVLGGFWGVSEGCGINDDPTVKFPGGCKRP